MTWTLRPSNDRADWLAFAATCPACEGPLAPLSSGNTTGMTSWLPVKCERRGCRREWAIKVRLMAVSDQLAQADWGTMRPRNEVPRASGNSPGLAEPGWRSDMADSTPTARRREGGTA